MTAAEKLVQTLTEFGIPSVSGVYLGEERRYFVFSFFTLPTMHADNTPGAERLLTFLHLFLPHGDDCLEMRAQIKKRLFEAGWTWPEEEDASDEHGQHYVFSAEIGGGLDGAVWI
ncbi:MAG: hypothetical protein KH334_02895 [Clostridiales bacterium]|nr:hypothetical protein [Clostridiales bacterium]